MKGLDPEKLSRLKKDKIIWFSSIKPDHTPHLVPVWFVFDKEAIWVCTSSSSVKVRNIKLNPSVAISLEDGTNPIIAEGTVDILMKDYPSSVVEIFKDKYDWNIRTSKEYDCLLKIKVLNWLMS